MIGTIIFYCNRSGESSRANRWEKFDLMRVPDKTRQDRFFPHELTEYKILMYLESMSLQLAVLSSNSHLNSV
ncbi:MAG TPA: hypothetical protein DD473_17860 [Planctomycetaceae bacterium]|nr:hypothetical protein [Planctomycetaceae bacterium]